MNSEQSTTLERILQEYPELGTETYRRSYSSQFNRPEVLDRSKRGVRGLLPMLFLAGSALFGCTSPQILPINTPTVVQTATPTPTAIATPTNTPAPTNTSTATPIPPTATPLPFSSIATPDNFRPTGVAYRSGDLIGVRHTDDGVLSLIEMEAPEYVKPGEYFTLRFRLDSRNSRNPYLFATFVLYPEFQTTTHKYDCKIFFTPQGVMVKETDIELDAGPESGVMLKPSACNYIQGGTAVDIGNEDYSESVAIEAPNEPGAYRIRALMQQDFGVAWPFTGNFVLDGAHPIVAYDNGVPTQRWPEYGRARRLDAVHGLELTINVR